jgi:PBP1b-binding outer membrane lipoprotein LpoB
MKKVFEFLDTWGIRVSSILVLIIFFKTCSTNTRVEKVRETANKTNERVDSLTIQLRKEIKIEGLESERRMIQSTDREMMDVTRQERIETIIDSLRNQK